MGNENTENRQAQEVDLNQVRKNKREKLTNLQAEGKDPFQITKYDADTHSKDIKDHFDEFEGRKVSIAGRIMLKRVMG
nr:lysine--tRNA ligase [Lachnospiraceae bacterium]